jgi:hypothetical protein
MAPITPEKMAVKILEAKIVTGSQRRIYECAFLCRLDFHKNKEELN